MDEPNEQRLNIPALVTITTVFVIAVLVSVIAVQAFVRYEMRRMEWQRVVEAANDELDQLNQQQQQRIDEYRWLDKDQGLVTIKMDRAIELYLQRNRNRG